jgi:RNA polymerase sigma factor (sigma-70 family)
MAPGPTTLQEGDDVDIDADDAPTLTSYTRRPQHEACLAEVFKMSNDQLIAALAIKKYDEPGYIPSEVLVTLARGRFGGCARVRNEVALTLNERLVMGLGIFLNQHLSLHGVMTRSSESAAEAVAYVRERIFRSKVDVSFPEVAFGPFLGTRFLDWFKSQLALKNSLPSIDALRPPQDDDGNELSLAGQVADEVGLTPEEKLERKQTILKCRAAVLRLTENQRTALTWCVVHDMTHKQAAALMGLSESSVQKYVKSALEALRNGDWHG